VILSARGDQKRNDFIIIVLKNRSQLETHPVK